jgi:predicted GIY-YIG superfamily endonuclease
MKYIYLIQSLEEGYYKIGVSKNPTKRLQQLQTGNSSVLKLIDTYKTEHADIVEKALQRGYKHLHKEGEWFNLSLEEEQGFNKNCKRIEDNIIFLRKNNNVFI